MSFSELRSKTCLAWIRVDSVQLQWAWSMQPFSWKGGSIFKPPAIQKHIIERQRHDQYFYNLWMTDPRTRTRTERLKVFIFFKQGLINPNGGNFWTLAAKISTIIFTCKMCNDVGTYFFLLFLIFYHRLRLLPQDNPLKSSIAPQIQQRSHFIQTQ